MATYADMQTRIADELHRSDLTARIKKAIVSAVRHYERKRFYFCESSFTFATVAGQYEYTTTAAAAIATSPNIERLNGTFFGTRTPLTKIDWKSLDDKIAMTTSRATPHEWAYRAKALYLYPVPDAVYTITAFNVPRLTELSADADENAWTNDAEELIRIHAKIDLIENQIGIAGREKELGTMKDRERAVLSSIVAETAAREATGNLHPSQF